MNNHQVEYLLIGGTAVGFYGYVRASHPTSFASNEIQHDLDFWYKPTLTNFQNLCNALVDHGVDKSLLDSITFNPKSTFLRIPFKNHKMEFLCTVSGIADFNEAYYRAKNIEIAGVRISIIGYHDLILNKTVTNREIDRTDIQELQKKNPLGNHSSTL